MENTLQMPECETTMYQAGDSAKIISFVVPDGYGLLVNGCRVSPLSLPVRIGKDAKIEVAMIQEGALPDFSEERAEREKYWRLVCEGNPDALKPRGVIYARKRRQP